MRHRGSLSTLTRPGRRNTVMAVCAAHTLTAHRGQRPGMQDVHERIRTAIAAFGRGEIVIVADDDDRENEGDLFVAANLCTAEKMAFIIRHTSGIVCAPITTEDARRLRLDPMVAHNESS